MNIRLSVTAYALLIMGGVWSVVLLTSFINYHRMLMSDSTLLIVSCCVGVVVFAFVAYFGQFERGFVAFLGTLGTVIAIGTFISGTVSNSAYIVMGALVGMAVSFGCFVGHFLILAEEARYEQSVLENAESSSRDQRDSREFFGGCGGHGGWGGFGGGWN